MMIEFKEVKIFAGVLVCGMIFIVSCKKNNGVNNPTSNSNTSTAIGNITGKIVLPTGSTVNVNTLNIISPVDSSGISNSQYQVKGFINTLNTTFVTNNSGDVVLMGYNIPGNSQSDISVESTSIAMVMNTPFALFLSTAGKGQLASSLKTAPEFNDLEQQIQINLSANKDLLDSNNVVLYNKLLALINSPTVKNSSINAPKPQVNDFTASGSSFDGGSSIFDAPALIAKSGKILTFSNPGDNIYSTTVGIYKDNVLQQNIQVDGLDAFPTSVADLIQGKGSLIGQTPVLTSYTMQTDGQYSVRMRTGLPLYDDGTSEYSTALLSNLANVANYVFQLFFPINVKDKYSCLEGSAKNIIVGVKGYAAGKAIDKSMEYYLENIETIKDCVEGVTSTDDVPEKGFFKKISKYLKAVDKGVALFGSAIDLTFYAGQWLTSKTSFDTCYTVNGNVVGKCNPVSISNPSNYPIVMPTPNVNNGCDGFVTCDFTCSAYDWDTTVGAPKFMDATGKTLNVNGLLLENITNNWGFAYSTAVNGKTRMTFYNVSIQNGFVSGKAELYIDAGACSPSTFASQYLTSFNFTLVSTTLSGNLVSNIAGQYQIASNSLSSHQ